MIAARIASLAALAVLALAPDAFAAPKMLHGHPNLSGYWTLNDKTPPDPALMARLAPNTAFLKDTGATEFPRGEYGGLKLTPAAQAAAKAWDPKNDLTIDKVCQPPSIIYAMQGPFPMEVFQSDDLIVFKLEYYDMVRVVFLDGRGHTPADAPHSKTGHSIGHWEGDTLVVATDHLEAATITNNGLSHTEGAHVIERFRLSADGKSLLSTQEFEDPAMLQNRGARFIAWTLEPGQYVGAYDCDPTFGLNYGAPGK
jgi:hypothetical protein